MAYPVPQYGPSGNRTKVVELSGRTVNYTYDPLYRLTQETIAADPAGINGTIGYVYDPVGNRLQRTSSEITWGSALDTGQLDNRTGE